MPKIHQVSTGNDADFLSFPPVIGCELLGVLLKKTPATISADLCRAPHKIPPSFKPPGSKSPLWVTDDVVQWLRQYQHRGGDVAPASPSNPSASHGRGKPRKAEQVEAARNGITVSELRRRKVLTGKLK